MKKALFAGLLLLTAAIPASAQIAISQLPSASLPLTGTEAMVGVQNGTTVQMPSNAIGVQGPTSSTAGHLPTFSSTTGRSLQDSGTALSSLAPLVSPSFTTPTLGAAAATSINFGGNSLGTYVKSSPTVSLQFGGASTGVTYGTRVATCTQVGDLVSCNIDLALTNKGSSTGTATISGLPTSATTGGASACSFMGSSFAASVATQGMGYVPNNSSSVNLARLAAGVTSNMADTDFTNTSEVILTCVYHTTGT